MDVTITVCVHVSYLYGAVQILIKFQKNGFLPSDTDIKSLNQEWEATFTSEVSALRHPHQPEPLLSLRPHPVTRKQGGQKSSFVKTLICACPHPSLTLATTAPLSSPSLPGYLHLNDGGTLVQSRAAQCCDSKVNPGDRFGFIFRA